MKKMKWLMMLLFLCFAGIDAKAQSNSSAADNNLRGKVLLNSKVINNDMITYVLSIPAMDKAFITEAEAQRSQVFQSFKINEPKHEVTIVMKSNAMTDDALLKIFQAIELKLLCPNYPSFVSSGSGASIQFSNDFDNWKNKYPEQYASYLSIFNLESK